MKVNKLFCTLTIIGLITVSGCTSKKDEVNKNSYYNSYEKIKNDEVMNLSSTADVNFDYSDANEMYKNAEQIVIARIDSIDGGSNYNEQTGEYIFPFTYGKMTILDVKKGELTANQQIDYIRMGGIITFDEYYNGLFPAEQQKLDANMEEKPKYVKRMFGEDIDIEAGKTYLMYIGEGDSKDFPLAKKDAYPIVGWEGGLRAIEGNPKAKGNLKVLNNITGEWETLDEVIPGK
ncbi:MAG: hypothetical protein HFE82_01410 [Erysipelotrichaceae bacterium]|mgnify:CR=1 FL=1|nr:hypothetical protein [Erysipelotrichaceae bacterium]